MSLNRVLRFLLGLIIAVPLLAVLLPVVGVPKSHYLPPSWVYQAAKGATDHGVIVRKYQSTTGNPFHVGDEISFIDFRFSARTPPQRGSDQLGPFRVYTGIVRVDDDVYKLAQPGELVRVRYDLTYPEINGIDYPGAGRSCSEGAALLSGWLIWVIVALILAYALMLAFEHFTGREDI